MSPELDKQLCEKYPNIEILKYESQEEAEKAANDMGWKMFKIQPIQEGIDND